MDKIGDSIYGQNSCAHVVYCSVNGYALFMNYADSVKKAGKNDLYNELIEIANNDLLLAKLIIVYNSSDFKNLNKIKGKLIKEAKSYELKYSDYLEKDDKKLINEYFDKLKGSNKLEGVIISFNIIQNFERDGFAKKLIASGDIDIKTDNHDKHFSKIVNECKKFISKKINPQLLDRIKKDDKYLLGLPIPKN